MNTRSALKRKAALEQVNLPQAQTLFPIASPSSKSPMNVPKLPSNQIQPSAAQIRRRLATLFPRGGLAENRVRSGFCAVRMNGYFLLLSHLNCCYSFLPATLFTACRIGPNLCLLLSSRRLFKRQ